MGRPVVGAPARVPLGAGARHAPGVPGPARRELRGLREHRGPRGVRVGAPGAPGGASRGLASIHPGGAASEEPPFERLRVIRHRRGRPHPARPGPVLSAPGAEQRSPGQGAGPLSRLPWEAWRCPSGKGRHWGLLGAPGASPGLSRGFSGADEAQRGMGGRGEDSPVSERAGEPQGYASRPPEGGASSPGGPSRSPGHSAPRPWAEEPAAGGRTPAGLVPGGTAPGGTGAGAPERAGWAGSAHPG